MNANDNNLIVIVRSNVDPYAFAKFTWSADMQDCDMVAGALSDEEIDVILEAQGHEGAEVAGYSVAVYSIADDSAVA